MVTYKIQLKFKHYLKTKCEILNRSIKPDEVMSFQIFEKEVIQ